MRQRSGSEGSKSGRWILSGLFMGLAVMGPLVSGAPSVLAQGSCAMLGGDPDGDGVCNDGDASGVSGDTLCASGVTAGCDDNCPGTPNPLQTNSDLLPAGDACQCADADRTGTVDMADVVQAKRQVEGKPVPETFDPDFCSVAGQAHDCAGDDVLATREWLARLRPGLTQLCRTGRHTCAFGATDSTIRIVTAALPLNPFAVNGSLTIACDEIDPVSGLATCTCQLRELDPFEIIAIGTVCVAPATTPCPDGGIACNGGAPLDVDVTSQHGGIGTCTDTASCAALCTAHCGASRAQGAACEGFCLGGVRNDLVCTNDSDCPGGSCPGKDGAAVQHTGQCLCSCITTATGPAARAGGLTCSVGVDINVERFALPDPCGNGDILIAVGDSCVPMTTEIATSVVNDANFMVGATLPTSTPPAVAQGEPGECLPLANTVSSRIRLVGFANFFDSRIGDLQSTLSFVCP
ncbi:MAG: hypothetical protein ACE5FG_03510 [Myxococcota bacterium]